jgi:hypothetical protein
VNNLKDKTVSELLDLMVEISLESDPSTEEGWDSLDYSLSKMKLEILSRIND